MKYSFCTRHFICVFTALFAALPLTGCSMGDVESFFTDVEKSYQMIDKLPSEAVLISESGISDAKTIYELRQVGYRGFLIGENFMKTDNPGRTLQQFIADIHG